MSSAYDATTLAELQEPPFPRYISTQEEMQEVIDGLRAKSTALVQENSALRARLDEMEQAINKNFADTMDLMTKAERLRKVAVAARLPALAMDWPFYEEPMEPVYPKLALAWHELRPSDLEPVFEV